MVLNSALEILHLKVKVNDCSPGPRKFGFGSILNGD